MEFKPIHSLSSQFEADMVAEVLTLEEIPFRIEVHSQDPLQNIRTLQEGYGQVLVPGREEARAIELITAVLNAPVGDPDELPPDSDS